MKKAKKMHNQGPPLGVPFLDPKMDQKTPPRGGVPPPTPKMIKMTPKWSKMTQNGKKDPKMVKNDPKRDPQRGTPPLDQKVHSEHSNENPYNGLSPPKSDQNRPKSLVD